MRVALGAVFLICLTAGLGCPRSANVDGGAIERPASCTVPAPTVCPDPLVRYSDVAPIILERCVTPCHSGLPEGPWPLTDYAHVADWADVVRTKLLDCSMPPPDAGIAMTDDERVKILVWILCGHYE